ncbi:MAG: response regulator [Sulfurospirillaceae bacterium]|nr:response regulator [Sulfurospirillaceae bacterium]MDD3463093.1 response regulator [Sulfurospirillaceae bacterium]
MSILQTLKEKAKDYSLLYVEDNESLRNQVERFLAKFFTNLYVAQDGEEGLQLYKKNTTQIVVTDIRMPKMDGLQMAKQLKKINPKVKIIVASAFDDKEYLYDAIKAGAFRYIKKPIAVESLSEILLECFEFISYEENSEIFTRYMKDIFNYQDNLLLLLENKKPLIANQKFFEFFDVKDLNDFNAKHGEFGNVFCEERGFIYNNETSWYEQILKNKGKLLNAKIKKKNGEFAHFALKVKQIPEDRTKIILSLDDISELGLLKSISNTNIFAPRDEKLLLNLLNFIRLNETPIRLHNYYKGLSIANEGTIEEMQENKILIKTSYLQQKAIRFEGLSLLSSEFLPHNVECNGLEFVDEDNGTASFKKINFVIQSQIDRKYVRVRPEEGHKAFLHYGAQRYDCSVRDISIKAARLRFETLPARMKVEDLVKVDIALGVGSKKLIIRTTGKVFRLDETPKDATDVVVMLDLGDSVLEDLREYISNRQIELIKEFKVLDK